MDLAGGFSWNNNRFHQSQIPVQTCLFKKSKQDRITENTKTLASLSHRFLFLSTDNDHTWQYRIKTVSWKRRRIDYHGNNRSITGHCPAD